MYMYRFECDYTEGCHPIIMEALVKTNLEQHCGYGNDAYCEKARKLIKEKCRCDSAQVHFLVGGTQTNSVVIHHILKPHQGVLSADSGHITIHETGAIESYGHKVLTLPSDDGKITGQQVREYCKAHFENSDFEHIVQPGMVYISNPTENGTIYSKAELSVLKAACDEYSLPLFIDGARLGYGLASPENDIDFSDLCKLCDIFYIGGTKVGALFGEALVIINPALQKDFRYVMKQHGAMLAKGRLLGIQFMTLFTDNLYEKISASAVEKALKIKAAFASIGCKFLFDSYTNQQYPILSYGQLEKLSQHFSYCFWCKMSDGTSAVRFCTSWATSDEAVEKLINFIKNDL